MTEATDAPEQNQKQSPKKKPQEVLAATPPRATRFRKSLVWGTVGALALAGAGLMGYGFNSRPNFKPQKASGSSAVSQNASTTSLGPTATYASVGNYGRHTHKASTRKTLTLAQSYAAAATKSTHKAKLDRAQLDAEKLKAKALKSPIFFSSTQAPGTAPAGAPGHSSSIITANSNASTAATLAALAANRSADATGGGKLDGPDEGLQRQKTAFVRNAGNDQQDYVQTPEQAPISKYEVQAGTVIPAALITAINSDLPGQVIAQVTQNVYDTPTGNYLLIPQGARLIGKYDSLIGFAQTRALIVWTRLIMPNGDSINLGGMSGADQAGASGLHDRVNAHNLALFAALGSATLLSFGPQLAMNIPQSGGGNTNIYTSPAQSLGNEVNSLGQDLVNRQLDRPNTVTIRPGFPLNVLVNKDMVLKPFESQ